MTDSSIGVIDQVAAAQANTQNVRTYTVTAYINGILTTLNMQVVALADDQGNPISLGSVDESLKAILSETQLQTEILLRMASALDNQFLTRDDVAELLLESA